MAQGKVLAGGAFNLIHPGHCHFLSEARKLGSELVVVVAHDRTVERNGKRPLFPAEDRAAMVGMISCVDRVVIGDPDDLAATVMKERPDVIAIGYDQDEGQAKEAAERAGVDARIVRIGELRGYSTRGITGG